MAFSWLSSLVPAFSHAAIAHTSEELLEHEKKRFFNAIQKEDGDTMTVMAQKHPDFLKWETEHGSTLKTAQEMGCFCSFVMLLGMGGNKNEDYGNGWTPLLSALAKDDKLFYEYLIGSRPNLDAIALDAKGRPITALQLAIDNRSTEAARMLIEGGALATLPIADKDGTTMTPEEYAVKKGQPKIAEMLRLAGEIRWMGAHRYDAQQQLKAAPPAPPAAA